MAYQLLCATIQRLVTQKYTTKNNLGIIRATVSSPQVFVCSGGVLDSLNLEGRHSVQVPNQNKILDQKTLIYDKSTLIKFISYT